MSETAVKLYEYFKSEKKYTFSSDLSIKALEKNAVKELESDGYITVKMCTIGYVIAEIS